MEYFAVDTFDSISMFDDLCNFIKMLLMFASEISVDDDAV